MTIESLNVVFYTCIFLLPGFIIKSVMDTLVPPAKHNDTKYFFSCLLYSIVNCAIWSWAYILLGENFEEQLIKYWVLLLVITVVGATLIAILIGSVKQKGIIEWLFSKLRINKIHPIPTAWDYYFGRQEESWIIVTLKSGRTIYGKYSVNSFASSDFEERDLYIEKTYTVNEGHVWIEDEKSKGIFISKEDIETIEFLR
ncbi:DUF6338 family protein [Hominifimenecus sp. rT4P-3]|uniref:DUF6338 family protein n=1 Tax=Hominifimenecus sp. rT4P-3 TaxID=3242979 RepID=UPI003DA30493